MGKSNLQILISLLALPWLNLLSNFSENFTNNTKMKYVAAYLLAAQSGAAPSKDTVSKILEAVGAEIEAAKLDKVLSELDGKSVADVIAEGMSLLASVPSGGAAPAAGAAAAGGAAPAEAAAAKKETTAESASDSDMGFDLFG